MSLSLYPTEVSDFGVAEDTSLGLDKNESVFFSMMNLDSLFRVILVESLSKENVELAIVPLR